MLKKKKLLLRTQRFHAFYLRIDIGKMTHHHLNLKIAESQLEKV